MHVDITRKVFLSRHGQVRPLNTATCSGIKPSSGSPISYLSPESPFIERTTINQTFSLQTIYTGISVIVLCRVSLKFV